MLKFQPCIFPLVAVFFILSSCMPTAGFSRGEKSQRENASERIKAGSETELKQETGQPLVTITGEGNDVRLELPSLPVDRIDGTQSKRLSDDSVWAMTLSEAWKSVSGWFYILAGLGAVLLVFAWRQFERSKIFKAAEIATHEVHQSMKGGLKVFNSIHKVFNERLHTIEDPGAKKELRHLFELIKDKESSLKALAPNGNFTGRGHL